ncbi:hypothetical protein QTH91_09650 [Variovorax dokdonensis]|uniref:Secreted protein n=1 Tax=Variovorax dokdonensis TaxID=344883 RepID=A0ABT7N9W8_9BURK|nr:hypothetical protein [Variovorax dokdonensis]MDM0044745.1 hypothetical protein [Variovorax dokdonensis]
MHRTLLTAAISALSAIWMSPASGQTTSFDLICPGIGERLEAHQSYGFKWDRKRHEYTDRSDIQYDNTQIEGSAQIEIHDGQGRIRPPKRLLPPLASGDHDGWWDLRELKIGADRITASYRLNALNQPTVDIDRRSGHIRIVGIETFEGSCSAFDPDKKRF